MYTLIEKTAKGNLVHWSIIGVHSSEVVLCLCVFHAFVCSTKLMKDQSLITKVES